MDVVMVSLVASSLVDLGFGPQKDQTKELFFNFDFPLLH